MESLDALLRASMIARLHGNVMFMKFINNVWEFERGTLTGTAMKVFKSKDMIGLVPNTYYQIHVHYTATGLSLNMHQGVKPKVGLPQLVLSKTYTYAQMPNDMVQEWNQDAIQRVKLLLTAHSTLGKLSSTLAKFSAPQSTAPSPRLDYEIACLAVTSVLHTLTLATYDVKLNAIRKAMNPFPTSEDDSMGSTSSITDPPAALIKNSETGPSAENSPIKTPGSKNARFRGGLLPGRMMFNGCMRRADVNYAHLLDGVVDRASAIKRLCAYDQYAFGLAISLCVRAPLALAGEAAFHTLFPGVYDVI